MPGEVEKTQENGVFIVWHMPAIIAVKATWFTRLDYVNTLQTSSNLSLTTTGEVTSQAHSLSVAEQDSNPCYYSMDITKEQYFI